MSKLGVAFEILGFSLSGFLGFVLNIIVILAVVYTKTPYKCTTIAFHLAMSNAIGSILVVILQGFGDTWLIEHSVCQPFLVFKSFWCVSAVLMTCLLVYESFFKVRGRMELLRKGETLDSVEENCLNVRFTINLLWASSLTVAFITFLMLEEPPYNTLCISFQYTRKDLVRFYFGFIIVLPLLTIAVLNLFYRRLLVKHKESVGTYNQGRSGKRVIQRLVHYTNSSFSLGQVLQILWVPHTVYVFWLIGMPISDISFNELAYRILKLLQWVCYLSCVCQPLVLMHTNYQIKIVVLAKVKAFWNSSCCSTKHDVLEEFPGSQSSSVYDIEEGRTRGRKCTPSTRKKVEATQSNISNDRNNTNAEGENSSSSHTYTENAIVHRDTTAFNGAEKKQEIETNNTTTRSVVGNGSIRSESSTLDGFNYQYPSSSPETTEYQDDEGDTQGDQHGMVTRDAEKLRFASNDDQATLEKNYNTQRLAPNDSLQTGLNNEKSIKNEDEIQHSSNYSSERKLELNNGSEIPQTNEEDQQIEPSDEPSKDEIRVQQESFRPRETKQQVNNENLSPRPDLNVEKMFSMDFHNDNERYSWTPV